MKKSLTREHRHKVKNEKTIKFCQVTKWIENLFEVKIRSNCRIPGHSFTCHYIRIASIVLRLDLQSLPTHVSEAEKAAVTSKSAINITSWDGSKIKTCEIVRE